MRCARNLLMYRVPPLKAGCAHFPIPANGGWEIKGRRGLSCKYGQFNTSGFG